MNSPMPHFLLFAETGPAQNPGGWRFVLRSPDGAKHFEAADVETGVFGERLDLLTLVRALESLDQPSQVTLIGCSNYLRQGIRFGMSEWRSNDWLWEWFGQMAPVKNADLWRRLDRLMAFHRVECGLRRTDAAHPTLAMANHLAPREVSGGRLRGAAKAWSAAAWDRVPPGIRRLIVDCEEKIRQFAFAPMKVLRILGSLSPQGTAVNSQGCKPLGWESIIGTKPRRGDSKADVQVTAALSGL